MRCGLWLRKLVIVVFFSLSVSSLAGEQDKKEWTWIDRKGQTRSRADLDEIIRKHKLWLDSDGKSGERADLRGARLSAGEVSGLDLASRKTVASVSAAALLGSVLEGADLSSADMRQADLSFVRLSGANLSHAKLDDAKLAFTDLSRCDLIDANLSRAFLFGANLSKAVLMLTELKDAVLDGANLGFAVFEPKSFPEIRSIASAGGLELITYLQNPDGLAQLRKQFRDGGFRLQEREITYALKRAEDKVDRDEAESAWISCREKAAVGCAPGAILWNYASYTVKTVLFDLTCRYGLSPVRPLGLGVALWFLCSLVYLGFIHGTGESGLYRIERDSGASKSGAAERRLRIHPRPMGTALGLRGVGRFLRREDEVLGAAMFFSAMSAFNIGFRDLNFGRWLRLLTRKEFDIVAVGWARVVSGWQSLISVYLIALWVLTYFGRPFE